MFKIKKKKKKSTKMAKNIYILDMKIKMARFSKYIFEFNE